MSISIENVVLLSSWGKYTSQIRVEQSDNGESDYSGLSIQALGW